MNTWQCSRHLLVPVSLTCGRISHLVGWSELCSQNRPFCLASLCKMSKNSNTSPLFKILFFSNIWIYFFCTVQIKDSCIVDIENGRFYLLFLRLIWDCTLLTTAEDVILDFNAFYRWFRAEVTSRKDFLLPFVAFYRWFYACSVTLGANLLLHFLVFGRLCAPVTVEADILSSLIIFYDWFCKRATAEADFLGSCRKYISPENRCLKKVETDRLHCELNFRY